MYSRYLIPLKKFLPNFNFTKDGPTMLLAKVPGKDATEKAAIIIPANFLSYVKYAFQ